MTFWANLYCGQCDMCQAGQEQLCREVNGTNYIGFVCNGAYAQQFVGKASNAYRLPDTVSDVAAGCIDPDGGLPRRAKVGDPPPRPGAGGGHRHHRPAHRGAGKKAGASYVALSKVRRRENPTARELGIFDATLTANDPQREAT